MSSIIIYDKDRSTTNIVDIEFDDIDVNMDLLYKCYRAIFSNLNRVRYGHYKSRQGMEGTNKKIRAQKRTGRSRQGSFKAVHMKGGSVKFGYTGDYHNDYHKRFSAYKQINKKEKKLCMKQIMINRLKNNAVGIVNYVDFKKTKDACLAISAINHNNKKCILIHNDSVNMRPFNNTNVELRHIDSFNCVDMMNHYYYIFNKESFEKINNNLKICTKYNF